MFSKRRTRRARSIFAATFAGIAFAQPQTFNSGSTGADGALTYAANLGTVYFPPSGLGMRPNNIYNFTTITIGAGTTVRVSGWILDGPVYWLAQGEVMINGVLDLSGQAGHQGGSNTYRAPSEPGAGGYSGGIGAGTSAGENATAGNGPGGGSVGTFIYQGATVGNGGTFVGSDYLVPMVGGSGGAGGCAGQTPSSACGGGGAGGGAILIASSTQIVVQDPFAAISVAGGSGSANGGGGSGGAIRLVANAITNAGLVNISGGGGGACCTGAGSTWNPGNPGFVRFEAFNLNLINGLVSANSGAQSVPLSLALPATGPSTLSVTSINGMPINANPFSFPDTTINTSSPVTINVQAQYVPLGTIPKIYIFSETGPDQVIPCSAPFSGTLQQSTCSASVTLPTGGSRGFVKATW